MFKTGLVLALFVSSVAFADDSEPKSGWENYSDPAKVSANFKYKFDNLPLDGHHDLPDSGWSSDYWANSLGSINRRWNTVDQQGFDLVSPTREQALSMSPSDLAQLAATEKFDLWLGRYDYPLVKRVDSDQANERTQDWHGICNGWAPAALNHAEPHPVTLTNPDGVKIPFGSSDIKALLSYYYAFEVSEPTRQIGLRCMVGRAIRGLVRGCNDDLNAGAFHVIIANKLGIERRGFVADIDRLREVWNQPIVGYQTRVTGTDGNNVSVKTDVYYVNEADPQWAPLMGTAAQQVDILKLEYTLELDSQGKIVGGKWDSWARPDFMWFRGKAAFTGSFAKLGELYEASIAQ